MSKTTEIVLKIDKPAGELLINLGIPKDGSLVLASFQVTGLVSLDPIFFQLLDIPASPVITGISSDTLPPPMSTAFPLFFGTFPNAFTDYQIPLHIMNGDNQMPDKRKWSYRVVDSANNPATFSLLTLRLLSVPASRYGPSLGFNEVKEEETSEMFARNQILQASAKQRDRHWTGHQPNFY